MDWSLIIAELAKRGLTQQKVAAACECSQATISDLATGKNTNPSARIDRALQALLVNTPATAPKNEEALNAA